MLYKNFSVQAELGDLYNVLALISIGTTKKDVDRLIKSIEIIAKTKKRSTKIPVENLCTSLYVETNCFLENSSESFFFHLLCTFLASSAATLAKFFCFCLHR